MIPICVRAYNVTGYSIEHLGKVHSLSEDVPECTEKNLEKAAPNVGCYENLPKDSLLSKVQIDRREYITQSKELPKQLVTKLVGGSFSMSTGFSKTWDTVRDMLGKRTSHKYGHTTRMATQYSDVAPLAKDDMFALIGRGRCVPVRVEYLPPVGWRARIVGVPGTLHEGTTGGHIIASQLVNRLPAEKRERLLTCPQHTLFKFFRVRNNDYIAWALDGGNDQWTAGILGTRIHVGNTPDCVWDVLRQYVLKYASLEDLCHASFDWKREYITFVEI